MINDYAAKQKFKIFSGLYWRLWFLKKVDHVGILFDENAMYIDCIL